MDRVTGSYFSSRSEVFAQNAMAATSQPLATQVALHIIKSGGNAIDAAIAANAILGLVEPTGAGIGGDLFVVAPLGQVEHLSELRKPAEASGPPSV